MNHHGIKATYDWEVMSYPRRKRMRNVNDCLREHGEAINDHAELLSQILDHLGISRGLTKKETK